MTEDEAKQNWCPFAQSRVVINPSWRDKDGIYYNEKASVVSINGPNIGASAFCIGSRCMAWRSERRLRYIKTKEDLDQAIADGWQIEAHNTPPEGRWFVTKDSEYGHCGLAGAP